MYKCNICGTVFDRPFIQERTDNRPDCFVERFQEALCPACYQAYFDEVDQCPCCHGYKRPGDVICEECGAKTIKQFRAMMDNSGFTHEQELFLDEKFEGSSLADRSAYDTV